MKERAVYVCESCGARHPQWRGQCPTCKAWNTLAETVERAAPRQGARAGRSRGPTPGKAAVKPLMEHACEAAAPAPSGLEGLDRLLGGGLIPGGVTLLGGPPGVGKSTLLLQLAGAVAGAGRRVLYVSGEESLSQLKARADRLGALGPLLYAVASTRLEDAADVLESARGEASFGLVIMDSVQTMTSSRADGLPGSVSQVRAVAAECVETAKTQDIPLVLVGHVTKEGAIAGPKLLEHMVDTVLAMEGDARNALRILRVLKNRFGSDKELAVFAMEQGGLAEVLDPSTLFLEDRDPSLSGSALAVTVEGSRPFAVEVQALAARSYLPAPRRTALGVDPSRLNLLLAVMEKRLSLNFGQSDIYVKMAGGLRMQDPGLDLALAAAVLSSLYDRPLPPAAVFWGEVDLNGRIRPVAGQETRRLQAQRLGWGPVFAPAGGKSARSRDGADTLMALAARLFGEG